MNKLIVAIVGRPNVGKSTLFNRLVGKRVAIVEDFPGVTRDRNYATCNWLNREFEIIDTGGFEPSSKEKMFQLMREQTQLAIEEADIIIYLFDVKDGLLPMDVEIVKILRGAGKKVIYVVNKVDNPKLEGQLGEFYSVGIDTLYPISAEHGLEVDVLLDEIIKDIPPKIFEEGEGEGIVKVAIVGRPNVGKSSILNKILGEERSLVSDVPGTTRDTIDSLLKYNDKVYQFVDTAGIRKKSKISFSVEKYSIVRALKSIDSSDVSLLIINAEEGVSDQDAKIGGYIHAAGKGCIIVINKWDLVEKDHTTMDQYITWTRDALKYLNYAPVLFVSATTGQRIRDILKYIEGIEEERRKTIKTAKLNKFLEEIVNRNPPSSFRNKSVKLYYITQVKVRPPIFKIFANIPKSLPPSYIRYIENRLREWFGFEGTPIKIVVGGRR
ncbi:MAG: ribosome biogenesis GTPase Der [bacterium]